MKLKLVAISEGNSTTEVQQTLNVLKTIEDKIKKDFQKELSAVESERADGSNFKSTSE